MFKILRQNNVDLLKELGSLKVIISDCQDTLSVELIPYYDWVVRRCDALQQNVEQNLEDINPQQKDIWLDILSNTQTITRDFRLFNQYQVSPILRSRDSDRLCLKILRWLHASNSDTQQIPVALSDEEFQILPMEPSIYFMPPSSQHGLLYLPLFFHEYGHLLYRCHKPEMEELILGFLVELADILEPNVQRNDRHAQEIKNQRNAILYTWSQWMQEIFCDAVGFCIGGPAFLRAFSMYLRMNGREAFQVPADKLAGSAHPVTFLRVRLLSDLVRRKNYNTEAKVLTREWEKIAQTLGIVEDYFGYYEQSYLPSLQQTIDAMLAESSPQMFTNQSEGSPVGLLNQAWQKFDAVSDAYPHWEAQAIENLLNGNLPKIGVRYCDIV